MNYLIKAGILCLLFSGAYFNIHAAENDTNSNQEVEQQVLEELRPGEHPNVVNDKAETELNGMIGPYDPTDPNYPEDPFYNFDGELEGDYPTADNYYTIAVTVPTNMEFTVLKKSDRNIFYSPKYTIENRATRPIYVSVHSLVQNPFDSTENFVPLYLRKPNPFNYDAEIELYLSLLNKNTLEKRRVLLLESFNEDRTSENSYLGVLKSRDKGVLTFESAEWDSLGRNAKTTFTLQLQFSLEEPDFMKNDVN